MTIALTPEAIEGRMREIGAAGDRRLAALRSLYSRLSSDLEVLQDRWALLGREAGEAARRLDGGVLPSPLHSPAALAMEIAQAGERIEVLRGAIELLEAGVSPTAATARG